MKSKITSGGLIISLFLCLNFNVVGQSNNLQDSTRMNLIRAAKEIMDTANYCALITLDEEGRPRVRVMDSFKPEEELIVWFGTNPNSRKVAQIKNDPRVTLYYLDNDASGYVMIHGMAQLVDDPIEKERHWKDEWKSFYPKKPEGYLLIKVVPAWMEILSTSRGILGDKITWQPPMVIMNPKK
jgi:general stress protein 26